jgi:Flp pilus assembly protein TadD
MELSPSPESPTASPRRHFVRVVGVAAVFALALWAIWHWQNPSEPATDNEPPAFTSPYLNVSSGVKYVGDKVCADCHAEGKTYKHHPMGRSAARVGRATPRESYGESGVSTFEALGNCFEVQRQDGRVIHKEIIPAHGPRIAKLEEEVALVIGSGSQGRSYLINRDGFLFQSPISWYARKTGGNAGPEKARSHGAAAGNAWGLSPGFARDLLYFNRVIINDCLFCHVDHVTPVEHTVNQFRQPLPGQLTIGCERCHGPGEKHVDRIKRGEAPAKGDMDWTIVNPRDLKPALRDAVCQQCHLQGEARIARRGRSPFDYRPGLPLQHFLSVFVRPRELADNYKIVSHVEQMNVSQCFEKSKGKMGCISCHDPHRLPEPKEKLTYYRGKCLQCHQEKSCRLEPAVRRHAQPGDNCVACHMPRARASRVHASITDHRILRLPDPSPRQQPGNGFSLIAFPFNGEPGAADALELDRDLGLALTLKAQAGLPPQAKEQICRDALPLLEKAVDRHPDDLDAREEMGYALWKLDRLREALAALEDTLARAPRREVALGYATRVAVALGEIDKAFVYCRRLLQVNPWDADGHHILAHLLGERRQWDDSIRACQAALRLNPSMAEVRKILITGYLHTGKKKEAQAEFERLLTLQPDAANQLKEWFAERRE